MNIYIYIYISGEPRGQQTAREHQAAADRLGDKEQGLTVPSAPK